MIDFLVRSTLGPLGSSLLDFYLQYSLIINGLILLYFLLLVLSRRSYQQALEKIIVQVEKSGKLPKKQADQKHLLNVLKKINISWEEAMAGSSFPLISFSTGFLFYPKNIDTLKKIFTPERLAEILFKKNNLLKDG